MTTLYLLIIFGQCLSGPFTCLKSEIGATSYAFGISAEEAFAKISKLPKGSFKLYAGSCQAEQREMSNLCMLPCPVIRSKCEFKEASVSTKTITVTEFAQ